MFVGLHVLCDLKNNFGHPYPVSSFNRFMDNLQTEVLELEYNEFSRGMPTITEEEFAQILLRYTILSTDDKKDYLTRLNERVRDTQVRERECCHLVVALPKRSGLRNKGFVVKLSCPYVITYCL